MDGPKRHDQVGGRQSQAAHTFIPRAYTLNCSQHGHIQHALARSPGRGLVRRSHSARQVRPD
eukprot:352179-Chlamydomonas_euryale.AAC.1